MIRNTSVVKRMSKLHIALVVLFGVMVWGMTGCGMMPPPQTAQPQLPPTMMMCPPDISNSAYLCQVTISIRKQPVVETPPIIIPPSKRDEDT